MGLQAMGAPACRVSAAGPEWHLSDPGNKLIPFVSSCVSINHTDTSAPGSRGHLSQPKCISEAPQARSAGPVAGGVGWGLELPLPAVSPPLQL